MINLRMTAKDYFHDHPDQRDGVLKAFYAYHAKLGDPGAHRFDNGVRCLWCGRTRFDVRWDVMPPQCQKIPDIAKTIMDEELRTHQLYERATRDVPRIIRKHGMSGKTLAVLHHTHGYDPETVDSIVSVPPQMMAEYHQAMEAERERSRASMQKEVITHASALLP